MNSSLSPDERTTREKICCPSALKDDERRLVLARRKQVNPGDKSPQDARDEIGLALSGGGIRSATFCLGVLQALADEKRKVLRQVDYLSTVSGGGYAGSFLGRLFTRRWIHESRETLEAEKEPEPTTTTGKPDSTTAFWRKQAVQEFEHQGWKSLAPVADVIRKGDVPADRVERILDDHQSKPMVWLRESGRYLAPTGGGDTMLDIAVAFRNWAAVTVVTVTLLFTVFLFVATVRACLWHWQRWLDFVESPLIARTDTHWWWSPWLLLPGIVFCVATLPLGWAYWMTQKDRKSQQTLGFAWVIHALARPWVPIVLIILGGIAVAAGMFGEKIATAGRVAAAVLALSAALTLFYYGCARRKAIPAKAAETFFPWIRSRLSAAGKLIRDWWAHRNELGKFIAEKLATPTEKHFPQIRNRLSKELTVWFGVTLGLLLFAIVDSFGQMAYAMLHLENGPGIKSFLSVTGLLVLFTMAKRIKLLLDQLPDRKAAKVPLAVLASVAALVLGGALLVAVSGVSHGLAWQWENPAVTNATILLPGTNLVAQFNGPRVLLTEDSLIKVADPKSDSGELHSDGMSAKWTAFPFLGCLILTFFFGHTLTFLNLSSHSTLYAARLTRAYHGASNPERWSGQGQKLGDAMKHDDISWRKYKPHDYGGPLHIVTTTLNETVGGKSQVEDRDRHGMVLAIGPAALTVGARFHALWATSESEGPIDVVKPIPSRPDAGDLSFGYHPLYTDKPKQDEKLGQNEKPDHDVESLRLSQWIGISGAAFSTGLGKGTSVGTSLIAGMANVRLGYWWDSHMTPGDRGEEAVKCHAGQLLWSRALPVYAHLFDEFLAQFRGPNNRLWYLSDGGHFENTGAYELIRRQLPCIIICDCGADPDYEFEDLAALVRMARVDFGAEIEFLAAKDVLKRFPGTDSALFGLPKDFRPEERAKNGDKGPHALFAEVTYPDKDGNPQPQPGSYLIILKPSVSGDESLDVTYYQSANPAFPQEPTSDQDFDEAQWESYRKLGRHIGEQVFPKQDVLSPLLQRFTNKPAKHTTT